MAENTDHPGHQSFLARLPISPVEILASALTIGFLLYVNEQLLNHVHEPMFIAPLGASIAILFIVPGMSWGRTWAVIGGQVLPSAVTLGIVYLLPNADILASMLAVALGLTVMHLCKCMHPPGVATALLIVASTEKLNPGFLLFPVLAGSCVVVASAWLVYAIELRLPTRWGGRLTPTSVSSDSGG